MAESADRSSSRKAPSKSDQVTASSASNSTNLNNDAGKRKPKPFSLLRTKPGRGDDDLTSPVETDKNRTDHDLALRTAPPRPEHERSFRDMVSSTVRHHSEDRKASSAARDTSSTREPRDQGRPQHSHAYKESSGHAFLSNIKNSASRGAGAISKGIFGKAGRTEGAQVKEAVVDDENYELKVINKPLIEQTRRTRISKRLEDSRDKTEFWMPAFPWRAIDYLNYKGSEMEGLYRVPGSGPQIKRWQRRFDEGKHNGTYDTHG